MLKADSLLTIHIVAAVEVEGQATGFVRVTWYAKLEPVTLQFDVERSIQWLGYTMQLARNARMIYSETGFVRCGHLEPLIERTIGT